MAEPRQKHQRLVTTIPAHWLPPPTFDVVQIPRAVWSAAYWDLPWDHLVALAVARQNGLCTAHKDRTCPLAPTDHVWMRRGDAGQALLYHQNWR